MGRGRTVNNNMQPTTNPTLRHMNGLSFSQAMPSPLLAFLHNPAVQRLSRPSVVAIQFGEAPNLSGRNSYRMFKDEPGHILAARRRGQRARKVVVTPIGGQ